MKTIAFSLFVLTYSLKIGVLADSTDAIIDNIPISLPITEVNSPSNSDTTTATPPTTVAPPKSSTTIKPPTTVTSTTPITPTTANTVKPPTTITTPTTVTTPITPTKSTSPTSTSPNPSTTAASPTTTPVPSHRRFDGPSFIGGIVLALGLVAIGFVAFKFYKARTELNYHTL